MTLDKNDLLFIISLHVGVYLSLSGRVIPNRGYVAISDIGTAGDNTALLCHTNCPPPPGSSTSVGEWFAPDGTTVHHANNTVPGFRRNRGRRVVRLYRNTVTGPPAEGIYYCRIKNDTNTWQIINVGLYNSAEGIIFHLHSYDLHNYITLIFTDIDTITVSDAISFTMRTDLVFTLTCISTGGPATTVTWTRDSVTVTEGTETHFDTSTYEYTHTLTVTGRLEGLYTCTVANDRPSIDSANITVQGRMCTRHYLTQSLCLCIQLPLLPLV